MCIENSPQIDDPDQYRVKLQSTETIRSATGAPKQVTVHVATAKQDSEDDGDAEHSPSEERTRVTQRSRPDPHRWDSHTVRYTVDDGIARFSSGSVDRGLTAFLAIPAAERAVESVPGIDSVERIEETVGRVIEIGRNVDVTHATLDGNEASTRDNIFR